MIPFLMMRICSLSLFATTMFRTSIRDGMKFYCLLPRSHRMMFWKVCTNYEYVSLINSKLYWNCTTEIHQKLSMPNYEKLKTMLKRSIDQKLRSRNFDARSVTIETGAVVTSRRGLSGIERGKGTCYQWKQKGQCSRGDQCSFRHESHDREKPTPKTARTSEPPTPRGRSASRKRSLRGRSQSGKSNRQPCKNFLKGTCAELLCDYWHPPECQFYKTESGCKAGDKCLFQHYKVEGQPNKRPMKGGDKSAVAIVKSVPQLGCVSQDTEPPESAAISRKGAFLGVYWGGRIHKKTREKRFCGRFRRKHTHGQQERPQQSRIGNREDIEKSDDGGNSRRRGANKRRGNSVCQRIGICRDSNTSRRYTGSSFTRKTLRRPRV